MLTRGARGEIRGRGGDVTMEADAGSEHREDLLLAVRMEEGPCARECRQPFDAGKGKETDPPHPHPEPPEGMLSY